MKLLISTFLFAYFGLYADLPDSSDSLKSYVSPSITVTSNRAEVGFSPISFSEMDQKQIELRKSAVDLPKILNNQPSIFSYSENGNFIGYSYLRLRGFDQRRISVYINGIPQNDPELHNVFWINFNDIQESVGEIQIQRGAGISNYGAPSIAGSINLNTSNFVNDPGIKLSVGGGFQEFGARNELVSNASKLNFEYSSGLVNGKYAFYAKLGRINSSGYRDNSYAQMNSWFLSAIRFDENLTTQINVYGGAQKDGLAYLGVDKSAVKDLNARTGNPLSSNELESFSSPHYEMLNDWKISDNLSFKSSLFYYEGEGYFDYDGGSFSGDYFGFSDDLFSGDPTFANTVIRAWVGNKHGGWIPRVIYKHNKGSLTAGAEIRIHRSKHWGDIQYSDNFPEAFDRGFKIFRYNSGKNVFSIFAREKYNVSDKLTLDFDAQLVYKNYIFGDERFAGEFKSYQTENGLVEGGELFNVGYLFFNPRFGANYKLSDKLNFYTSVALTSREPRRNSLYNADFAFYGLNPLFSVDTTGGNAVYDFDDPLLEPEQMLNIELGANYQSEYVTGSANFYLMDYSNELIPSGQVDAYGAPIDGNAPKTIHYGVEVSGRHIWMVGNESVLGFDINAMYSINEIVELTSFATVTDENGNSSIEEFDLAGNNIAGFPDAIINAGLDYAYSGFNIRLDAKYVSDMYLNNFNDAQYVALGNSSGDNIIDSYLVFDINSSYRINDFLDSRYVQINFQVNNVSNELYAPFATESGFLPAAERNYWLGVEVSI